MVLGEVVSGRSARAVPTPDHFIPLLYTAGVAAAEGTSQPMIQGYPFGSLSMTSYNVGTHLDLPLAAEGGADLSHDAPLDQAKI